MKKKLYDLGLGNGFMGMTLKPQATKTKRQWTTLN